MMRVIRSERMKLRRSPVWLAFFILPLLPAIMGTFNYLQNTTILTNGWYSLWTQHTLFYCFFFFPPLVGVYCSYLCRLEHQNHNWNVVLALPVRISSIYFAKLFAASVMVLMTQALLGVLFMLAGKLAGIPGPLPPELIEWLLLGALGAVVVAALQLDLSLVIRSFAVPPALALLGGFVGMFALSEGFGVFFPYALISLGMRANRSDMDMACSSASFVVSCALFLSIFCVFGILWLKKRDAVAG